VTWNAPLDALPLVYNCGIERIEARVAHELWGPWSAPIVLLSTHDAGDATPPTMALTDTAR
jgi:hypothetical protein